MADLVFAIGDRGDAARAAPVARAALDACLGVAVLTVPEDADAGLHAAVLDELGLPEPVLTLPPPVGEQRAEGIARGIAAVATLRGLRPGAVVLGGSSPPLLGLALAASGERIPVAALDAGLRPPDPLALEASERRLIDQVATYLFAPSPEAADNLHREAIPRARIDECGSTIPDAVESMRRDRIGPGRAERLGVPGEEFALVVVQHRDTVEQPELLSRLLEAVLLLGRCVPVLFPVHPRTRRQLFRFGLNAALVHEPGVIDCDPLPYADFLEVLEAARVVLTDAGTVQDEAAVLGTPCVTVRATTDRRATCLLGANVVAGPSRERLVEAALASLESAAPRALVPERWDRRAGRRIVERLAADLELLPRRVASRG